jgi:hypothetical protein
MIEPANPVLEKMLDRLFASMVNGPSMNCRPHASRQRLDLAMLARLADIDAGKALLGLLGPNHLAKVAARVPQPAKGATQRVAGAESDLQETLTPEERTARQAWSDQQSLLTKIRVIADDARTYEQDTGVHALNVGFPLLSLPPGTFGGRAGIASRRVLAPIAFIPVTVTVKSGTRPTIELACRSEGVDLVVPNIALLAWLEQQTGQPFANPFDDDKGEKPWQEIAELVKAVAKRAEIKVPEMFLPAEMPEALAITSTPRAEQDAAGPSIVNAAVLGLFPTANQGLLADTRAILAAGIGDGPIESFIRHGVSLEIAPAADAIAETPAAQPPAATPRNFADERLVSLADPCQARAVRLARTCKGLVIHGPPGTGKSQTITNVIGDHLARGERVLFVCDKRTALDVVADRLGALGLGDLCATVHDPQRDQRELYRSVREQLDNLADTALKPNAADKLKRVDAELQQLHHELASYRDALMGKDGGPGSFHHLVGQWLSELGEAPPGVDLTPLERLPLANFERHQLRTKEMLERGEAVDYARNPWRQAAGLALTQFLAQPMDVYRAALARFVLAAQAADATADPLHPPFGVADDITAESQRRQQIAARLPELLLAPQAAKHWSAQPPAAVIAARTELKNAAVWLEEIKARPLDPSLKAPEAGVSADQLAAEAATLSKYAAAFAARATQFARLRAAAPDADEAIALKWLAAAARAATAAKKRLDAAAALADAVGAGSLDSSLLARFEASPLPPQKLIEALAALSAYLDIASTWHASFHFGVKKAADPFVRHFGLSLSADSARQVRQFLSDLQKRIDLHAAVEAATGQPFGQRADDTDLVTTFGHHRNVLAALLAKEPTVAAAAAEVSPTATAALNALLGTDAQAASALLQRHGLTDTGLEAARLAAFLKGLEARLRIAYLLARAHMLPDANPSPADADVLEKAALLGRLLDLLAEVPPGNPLGDALAKALSNPATAEPFVAALERSPLRAQAVLRAYEAHEQAKMFSPAFATHYRAALYAGKDVAPVAQRLSESAQTLEGVIRISEGITQLPPLLKDALRSLLDASPEPESAISAVRRHALAGEISRRLQAEPQLQAVDDHRVRTAFNRFRELAEKKKSLVVDLIRDHWISKQKERLLAGTGTRLNAAGADLRRRLTTRGERAMRLRQVVAHGANTEGGDPLLDLRPVWMASPETVAELFPREPVFDVIIFDEASQCRLEEALPVVTRAHRVVIAGDPRQLPPSRFFESAVVSSDDVDAETDQEWFELHQGEVEDLLTAALGLDVQQCYLDVHYRSRNSDLIEFSNEHFYASRLQAIPGHPRNRSRFAPITLYRVEGVYEKRRNVIEAEQVCKIVRDLLKRSTPPSIGIACFNLVQRDLIVEKLEEMAEEDATFARRLTEARERRGPSSSEGLFVKNLENVQGDERDHLIISTTYGPDPAGKFRRSFGPLGTAGGGRRLNVLVTRARNELHVVTSIPRAVYTSLPDVPTGTMPSGGWLLFAYLAYAERLQEEYETNHRILEDSAPAERASVNVRPTRNPSEFAKALASRVAADHNFGSDVHWGNEGFGIDVAMQHPNRAEDVTIGILCDMSRFSGSDDPVEWDVFRTAIHESQGWKLHRVWTPHFFRDPKGATNAIAECVREMLAAEVKEPRTK